MFTHYLSTVGLAAGIIRSTWMYYVPEAGVLKANPPVFWPKRLPPRLSDGAVVAAAAGVPKEKPPVLAAGALQEHKMQRTLKTNAHMTKHP